MESLWKSEIWLNDQVKNLYFNGVKMSNESYKKFFSKKEMKDISSINIEKEAKRIKPKKPKSKQLKTNLIKPNQSDPFAEEDPGFFIEQFIFDVRNTETKITKNGSIRYIDLYKNGSATKQIMPLFEIVQSGEDETCGTHKVLAKSTIGNLVLALLKEYMPELCISCLACLWEEKLSMADAIEKMLK
jgi:hypothetical protein